MIMKNLVNELLKMQSSDEKMITVSKDQYDQWAKGFVFDGMRSLRYGQSFCNHFGITDNILFYSSTVQDADQYILKTYVK